MRNSAARAWARPTASPPSVTGTMVWYRSFGPDAKQGRRPKKKAARDGSRERILQIAFRAGCARDLDALDGGVDAMNEAAAAAIQGKPDIGWLHHHPLYDNESPVWNRFYFELRRRRRVRRGEPVRTATRANRMVIGHTVQSGGMRTKCGGKLHLIDVGMSSAYGGGRGVDLRGRRGTGAIRGSHGASRGRMGEATWRRRDGGSGGGEEEE